MTQAKSNGSDSNAIGRIVARPIGATAILSTIGVRPSTGGPWSYVCDVPGGDGPLVAPPPHYYALAGWGACTAVTVTGVAHRGKVPLEGLGIDFKLERVSTPGSAGFGVHKKLFLHGKLSDTEVVRLRRAANFCPVDQLFTKGALSMEEHIVWASGDEETVTLENGEAQSLENDPPAVVPGAVNCRHLVDTKVYEGDSLYEGEVQAYLCSDERDHEGRWVTVAGHSFDKWVPAPFPLALAGLAASTAATLRQTLVVRDLPYGDLRVEVGTIGLANRGEAQASADTGHIRERPAVRRVIVPGDPSSLPVDVVRAALLDDSVSRAVRIGGVILGEDVEVV